MTDTAAPERTADTPIEERAERYRDSFAGVVQGNCEDCGTCCEDADGKCACDHIVDELIGRVVLIDEEEADLARASLKQSEIDRMLVLIYRSNNAHDYVNFTRPYGWLDKLPMAGLEELLATFAAMQRDVADEIRRRRNLDMTQFSPTHYAKAETP